MSPSITVVTPTYNDGAFIERTIASVVAQQGVDVEYIVVDGGSTDGTAAVLERWRAGVSRVISERDDGQADAIRKGWDLATGDYITWLNADDCYTDAQSLARLAAVLDEEPDVDLVYGIRVWIDEQGAFIRRDPFRPFDDRALRAACFLPQECALMRRATVARIGGIDRTKRIAMDYDLWLRLLDSGATFRSHPVATALFRVRAGQKSSALWDEAGRSEVNALQAAHNGGVELDDDAMARAAGEHLFGLRPDDDERARAIPGGLWSTVDASFAAVYRGRPIDRWALPTG